MIFIPEFTMFTAGFCCIYLLLTLIFSPVFTALILTFIPVFTAVREVSCSRSVSLRNPSLNPMSSGS